MEICRTKSDLRALRDTFAGARESVALVPTMGYLHAGHLSLMRAARERSDRVIATIFVNPTQFGPNEDLDLYPRDLDRDIRLLEDAGVDALFAPAPSEMYVGNAETVVEATALSRILIGRFRPGHFRGVATVVTKLFNIAQPDTAFFGQKDYQQLCVIRRMVRDLDVPVAIEGVPIVREADGLAMSSRNVRLSAEQRAAAPALHDALREGVLCLEAGRTVMATTSAMRDILDRAKGAEIQSIDIRDAEDLSVIRGRPGRPAVLLLAVRFGDVLLIDNMVANPGDAE